MGQAQINVRTQACSRTSIARTKQAALTHSVRGKRLSGVSRPILILDYIVLAISPYNKILSRLKIHFILVMDGRRCAV